MLILTQGVLPSYSELCPCKYSAFTAVATSIQMANANDVLAFDEMITNLGDDFNLQTDIFTCRISGLYVFSWSVRRGNDATDPDVELQKNGQRIASVYVINSNDPEQNSNTVTLELQATDEVKLVVKPHGGGQARIYNDDRRYTTFTGYLLYRDGTTGGSQNPSCYGP